MLIDWFTVAAQIVNFLILVALLRVFLYNRIIKAMDAREQTLADRLAAAEQQKQVAEDAAASYRQKQQELEVKRAEMLAQARADADNQRQVLIDQARQEVERLQGRWQQAIRDEKEAFLLDLRQRATQQMYAVARRALTDLARVDLEQQMLTAFLDKLQTLDEDAWQAIATARQDAKRPLVIHSAFDLPPAARQKLQGVLQKHLGEPLNLRFETAPEVMCGIELQTEGRKIAWSLEHYLEALEESLATAFEGGTAEATDGDPVGDAVAAHRTTDGNVYDAGA